MRVSGAIDLTETQSSPNGSKISVPLFCCASSLASTFTTSTAIPCCRTKTRRSTSSLTLYRCILHAHAHHSYNYHKAVRFLASTQHLIRRAVFAGVCMPAQVDYLAKPLQVFEEMYRVMKPGKTMQAPRLHPQGRCECICWLHLPGPTDSSVCLKLRIGGLAIMSFSNRMFWTKAIKLWYDCGRNTRCRFHAI